MTTIKKAAAKLTADLLVTHYMDYVLNHGQEPKTVFALCKEYGISEAEFYCFYGTLEGLKRDIWVRLFGNIESTLLNDPQFRTYSTKDKLIATYFTSMELFTLNRSFILATLDKRHLEGLADLKDFRTHFKRFVESNFQVKAPGGIDKLEKYLSPALAEGAWIHFLLILKFWIDDASANFEKTDIFIEKSVTTVMDLINTSPIDNLIDLGKFLWKEKVK